MLYTIMFFLVNTFQTYEVWLMLTCFLEPKYTTKCRLVFGCVGLYLFLTIETYFINIPILNMLSAFCGILFMSFFLFEGSWRKKLLTSILGYFLMFFAEAVVIMLLGNIWLDLVKSLESFTVLGLICITTLLYMVVLIVRNFRNMHKGEILPFSYWLITVMLPVVSLYLFFLICVNSSLNMFQLVSCTSAIFLLNILVVFLYDHLVAVFRIEKEKETLELQNKYQTHQLELMHQAGEQVRAQRHDFKKHISMLSNMCRNERWEDMTRYLEELAANNILQQTYVESGNYVIDSILNYKIQEALSEKISVEANIQIPQELSLSVYDMTTVLTNLLDNSMEAVKKTEQKTITVTVKYRSGLLQIKTGNPYIGEVRRDSTGKFLTSKTEKENHGYGLSIVRHLVEERGGRIEIRTNRQYFEVDVVLPLENVTKEIKREI